MAEQLPATPTMISWARERAGLSLDQASETFRKIAEWEQGESSPTYAQLEQMAERFKLPVAAFFFPAPPQNLPPIEETFRTLPEAELVSLPSRVKFLLRKAKAFQLNLAEMTGGRNPATRLITKDVSLRSDSDVPEMAEVVRAYLGVSLDQQAAWQDDDTALKAWRSKLADVGVFVFKDAFQSEKFSGFSLYDATFPVIFVNNSSAKTRQIFTLFHELAHLLFGTSGIDTETDDYLARIPLAPRRIEILSNRFAAAFLLPDYALTAEIAGKVPSEATASEIAARFHVSRETVFRKFLDRGWIDQSAYRDAAARWATQRKPGGGGGGDYYWTKLAYLGREYVSLALGEFKKNRIDESQLADYLDIKPRNLAGLEEHFERASV